MESRRMCRRTVLRRSNTTQLKPALRVGRSDGRGKRTRTQYGNGDKDGSSGGNAKEDGRGERGTAITPSAFRKGRHSV